MSWDIKDIVARRLEFVTLASAGSVSIAALCRRFGISRKTGYKWLRRFRAAGAGALHDQPRRSGRRTSNQTARRVERAIVALRQAQPTWGPRKLHRRLCDLGCGGGLPALSTIAQILRRHGCISPAASRAHQPWQRFSRAEPNQLWQMDFKGHFALARGGRCHPFTALDDCSRYLLALEACGDQQTLTVQGHLERMFRVHGLPEAILCDRGSPWGGSGPEHTVLTVWLLRLGVRVLHGRPYHPQTQGKEERFHRTLQGDLLARHDWLDLAQAQRRFDRYRRLYNHERPHQALDMTVPAARYRPSARTMPRVVPVAHYDAAECVRAVKQKGEITFANRSFYIGQAFHGLSVALRPHLRDGVFRVCYAAFTLGLIDLSAPAHRPKGRYHPLLPLTTKCHL